MEKNKIMEGLNEEMVYEGVTKTKGGLLPKLAVGAIGVAAAVGAVLFLKKKKQDRDVEIVESDSCDVEEDNNDNEE